LPIELEAWACADLIIARPLEDRGESGPDASAAPASNTAKLAAKIKQAEASPS
jgi:hypothetical protein